MQRQGRLRQGLVGTCELGRGEKLLSRHQPPHIPHGLITNSRVWLKAKQRFVGHFDPQHCFDLQAGDLDHSLLASGRQRAGICRNYINDIPRLDNPAGSLLVGGPTITPAGTTVLPTACRFSARPQPEPLGWSRKNSGFVSPATATPTYPTVTGMDFGSKPVSVHTRRAQ